MTDATVLTGEVEYSRLSKDFPELISQVVEYGTEEVSRLGRTKEIVGLTMRLWQPQHCIVGRSAISKEFMDLEILMLLAGTFDESLIRHAVPRAADLISIATAYGPRTAEQYRECVRELRRDPTSRRAVAYVGRHEDLGDVNNPEVAMRMKAEMPCTMTHQFLVRNGMLHMLVNMRSWDLVWGLCYDVPCFVAVQMAVAKAVGAKMGAYFHHAGSGHIYERHWGMETWDNEEQGELKLPWLRNTLEATQQQAENRLNVARRKELM